MKKMLLILAVLIALPGTIKLKAQDNLPSFSGVIVGTAFTGQDFGGWSGGVQMGVEFNIDGKRGLSMRTLYSKWNVGVQDLEAIQTTGVMQWYLGQRWGVYFTGGIDMWLNGGQGSDMIGGFGLSYKLLERGGAEWLIPFKTTVFAESVFSEIGSPDPLQSGSRLQINLGFKFQRPVHR